LFLLMLDSTVVALALPTIERDLHASAENVQWVLNGYLLVISVLMVTAGRLGDIAGRRSPHPRSTPSIGWSAGGFISRGVHHHPRR
jgi:MFS family permease